MPLETLNENLTRHLRRCDQCANIRTHSTQRGYETAPGVIEWREEINGCAKHKAVPVVVKLDGTSELWSGQ